jgi:hypothetical protein
MPGKDIEVVQLETDRAVGEKFTERVDHHGFKLVPQPSHFKDDPLVSLANHEISIAADTLYL